MEGSAANAADSADAQLTWGAAVYESTSNEKAMYPCRTDGNTRIDTGDETAGDEGTSMDDEVEEGGMNGEVEETEVG
jgi:hypothetical protein